MNREWGAWSLVLVVGAGLAALCVWAFLREPTVDEAKARYVLETEGYENIRLGGYAGLCTSSPYESSSTRRFTATNARGKEVSGIVCCQTGGCTVRH